jgi:16S rRNA (cytidine1402-2'-O)-methyltransferase
VVNEVSNATGKLFVVATPIGNLDDVTRRAIDVLGNADTILAEDTRHSRRLLDHLGIQRPMIALHQHNEAVSSDRLLARLEAGETMALISDAGTPLISDPGYPLVAECRLRGIEVIPIPGPSAVIAALSVAGLPTDRFRFEGFPPRRPQARETFFEALAGETATLVFYEASHRIEETLATMLATFGAGRQAVLARELTKRHETIISGGLDALLARVRQDSNQRKGEFVVLLAGATDETPELSIDGERVLRILLEELPLKQAAKLAAQITGEKKNRLYARGLELAS